jgi:DNA-binding response OmpR family regulator
MQKLLVSAQYRVTVAPEGKTALRRVRTDPPDLVILDLLLPGMDGYSTLSLLKRGDKAKVPVLVVSGRSREQDEKAALDAGADAFLHKPVDAPELLAAVKRLLEPARS